MHWRDKIRRLLTNKNASELSRSVGLHPSAIGATVTKGNLPKADKAVKIANALGVPAEWLFDESHEWPPPSQPTLADITAGDLVGELARRRELIRRDMHKLAAPFSHERLVHLDRVVAFGPRSDEQRKELDDSLKALFVCEMLARQLQWLNPDEANPPAEQALSGTEITAPYTSIAGEYQKHLAERGTRVLATPVMTRHNRQSNRESTPRYDLEGKAFPAPLNGPTSASVTPPAHGKRGRGKARASGDVGKSKAPETGRRRKTK